MFILVIVIFLFAAYSILIMYYWRCWESAPDFVPHSKGLNTTISIIVAARNEEENIGKLLSAIQEQTYPISLSQVIVVNDHSTDSTGEIVKKFKGVTLIDLTDSEINSYKKKAIQRGIEAASGKLIITTDADCLPPPKWLETIVTFYEEKKGLFIAAPVMFETDSSIIELFQSL